MTPEIDPPPEPPAVQDRPVPLNRRRPGRRGYVAPALLHVLRSPHRADPEAQEAGDQREE